MTHPSTRHRRISAVTVRAGSNRRLNLESLRRCKTTEVSASSTEDRTSKIRNWVVGFLGRKLTAEEEDILQDDCSKFPRDVADHEAARKVVQSLFSSYFLHAGTNAEEEQEDEGQGPKTRTNSIHLEAEAYQVETMAAFKIQALVRGHLRRQWYTNLPGRQQAAAAAKKWVEDNYRPARLSELSKSASERMSDMTKTETKDLKQALNAVEVSAVTLLQAFVRGFLCRQQPHIQLIIKPQQRRRSSAEASKDNNIPAIQAAASDETASIEEVDMEPVEETAVPEPRESLTLTSIPETKPTQQSVIPVVAVSRPSAFVREKSIRILQAMEKDENERGSVTMADISTKNNFGMQLLNESQHELSFVTELVKVHLVIKVQSLVRRFLVRRRRRRLLRKAQSIRMLKGRPSLIQVVGRGTPAEHKAAIEIQRIFRGFVQRWKYWTAMRQQQLEEILALRAKQLRKIEERKKSVLKSTKKQLFFDATSLARQLQRAKRVIKFLVKEEKRFIQQNERLAAEVSELTAKNQLLENSTKTASNSNETLQDEIQQLQSRNQRLQAAKKEYSQTLKNLTLEWTKANKQVSSEKQRKEEVKACIEKIQEKANDFLQEHPQLLQDANSLTLNGSSSMEPSKQQVTAT